jgi:Ran-binding protein 1
MIQEEEHDPHYEPVIRLTEKDQVEVKTHEEDEEVLFKMCADVFVIRQISN